MVKTSEASEARDEESDDGVISTGEPELRFPKHRSQALLNIESMIYQKDDKETLARKMILPLMELMGIFP
ncbi:unnamed protein product [Prunus armeniaca]